MEPLKYDIENLTNPEIRNKYYGEVTVDHYGRYIPKHAHGTKNLDRYTSSTKIITEATLELYDNIGFFALFSFSGKSEKRGSKGNAGTTEQAKPARKGKTSSCE